RAGHGAAQRDVLAAEKRERVARAQPDVVGQVDRRARIERGIAANVERARAKRAAIAEHESARVEVQAAGEGVRSVEGQHRCAVLDQAAGATHDAAERQVLRTWQGERRAEVHVVGEVERGRTVQRRRAVDVQRARAQRAAIAQHEAAAIEVEAAAEAVRAVQGQQRRTVLDQRAGTRDHAAQRDVLVAEQIEVRVERDIVGEVERRRAVERGRAVDRERAGTEGTVIAEQQATGIDRETATERVRAGERLHAGPVLHQAAGAADHAAEGLVRRTTEGQRVVAERDTATHRAGEIADGLVATAGDVQVRSGGGKIDRAARGQTAVGAQRDRSRVDRQAAREGVRAVERQRRRAVLDHAARTRQHAAEGQRLAAQQVQAAAAVHHDVVGEVESGGGIQRCAATHRQVARAQCAGIAQHEPACVEVHTATEQVRAAQAHDTRVVHRETARARQDARQAERIGAPQGQAATAVEGEIVRQRQSAEGRRDGAAGDVQLAGAEAVGIVEVDQTVVDRGVHSAGADGRRALQVPRAAVDGQVLEVDVVVPVDRGRRASRARSGTRGRVLQQQAVVAAGAAIDDAGRGELHGDAGDGAGDAGARVVDRRAGHGGEGVAGGRVAHVHGAVDGAGVDEGIAGVGGARRGEADASGDGAGVGEIGLRAAVAQDRRRVGRGEQGAQAQDRHAHRAVVHDVRDAARGVLRDQPLAAEAQQRQHVHQAVDLATGLVVDVDRVAARGVVAEHGAGG
ncbi:hypothetical protein KCV01_g20199, partial [Aureobasidium melanogenum]